MITMLLVVFDQVVGKSSEVTIFVIGRASIITISVSSNPTFYCFNVHDSQETAASKRFPSHTGENDRETVNGLRSLIYQAKLKCWISLWNTSGSM